MWRLASSLFPLVINNNHFKFNQGKLSPHPFYDIKVYVVNWYLMTHMKIPNIYYKSIDIAVNF